MLKSSFSGNLVEAGCDEAGRGCLAGPVFAAAVILPENYNNKLLNDSKKLSRKQREDLRIVIEQDAIAWAVATADHTEIDKYNILQASILAMHRAIENLIIVPQFILVDGNRFKPFMDIDYKCFIHGDGTYMSIAAASILAKTYRDDFMQNLHDQFPVYGWNRNKGYPTLEHRRAVIEHGFSAYHRMTFSVQVKLWE